MNPQNIRWGIIGAGIIAHQMADAINIAKDNTLVAVASRTAEKAQDFAEQYAINAETYESLITRDDIDVIYIATTHNFHCDNALQALAGNKNLVIEKPFTVNAEQAKKIVTEARARNLFVMEAIWTRFLPSMQALREQVAEGEGGRRAHVRSVCLSGGRATEVFGVLWTRADRIYAARPRHVLLVSCSRWCSRSPRTRSTSRPGASSSRRSCRAGSRRRCR